MKFSYPDPDDQLSALAGPEVSYAQNSSPKRVCTQSEQDAVSSNFDEYAQAGAEEAIEPFDAPLEDEGQLFLTCHAFAFLI